MPTTKQSADMFISILLFVKQIASFLAMTNNSCQAELVEALLEQKEYDEPHFDKLSVTLNLEVTYTMTNKEMPYK